MGFYRHFFIFLCSKYAALYIVKTKGLNIYSSYNVATKDLISHNFDYS